MIAPRRGGFQVAPLALDPAPTNNCAKLIAARATDAQPNPEIAAMNDPTVPRDFYFYRGRTALYALLRAIGIRPGDEILVQAYTCLAVVLPILGLGAVPVYADITPSRFSFEPASVEPLITPRSRVLIVQHTFGIPATIEPLLEMARRHQLVVVEDCCHVAPGGSPASSLGSFGVGAIFSYQWSKPLVLGRGGSARINDPHLAARMTELYASFAWPKLRDRVAVNLQYAAFSLVRRRKIFNRLRQTIRAISPSATGTIRAEELNGKITAEYNQRMPLSLQHRLAAKLHRAPSAIARCHARGTQLHAHLQRLGVSPLDLSADTAVTFLRYPLLTDDRQRLVAEGRARGIEIEPYYVSPIDPLMADEWPRVRYTAGSCPVAESIVERTVTIPIHAWTRDEEWERVLAFLEEMQGRGRLLSGPGKN